LKIELFCPVSILGEERQKGNRDTRDAEKIRCYSLPLIFYLNAIECFLDRNTFSFGALCVALPCVGSAS
jgi:hypothetical protein